MPIFKLKPVVAIATSIALSCVSFSRPVNANPAVIAPAALCAGTAGIGCVLVGVAAVGGTVYYVWRARDGKHYAADRSGNINTSERMVGVKKPIVRSIDSKKTIDDGMDGIQAAKLGEAHWVTSPDRCNRPNFKQGRPLKVNPPPKAQGGGFWCIY
jgi:hypothetical protein